MKQTPHFVICGNYGATNIGDEAILQSILQFCRHAFPHADITVISSNPARTAEQYDVKTVPMMPAGLRSYVKAFFSRSMRKTLHAYKRADAVIFGGGGLFTDERPHAIFIWLMQILPAFRYKKPVMSLGQSVGPLMNRWSRWVVGKIFRKMKIVTVRDEASQLLLRKLNVRNIHVLPDPVFGFHLRKSHESPAPRERKPYIVFSLRPWIRNAEKIRGILAQFVDWIFETYHLRTYFVPFQSLHDDDENECLQVLLKLEHRSVCEVLSHNEEMRDTLKLMEESTAVIGMRLHSIIFSAITHTPFLALSYSLKVAEVAKQLGMEDFLDEYRFVDLDTLKKKFEKLFSERTHVEKSLEEMHKELEHKTEQYAHMIKQLVDA